MRIKLETFLFSLLFVEGKRCFQLHGSLSPSRKVGTFKIRDKKYDFPLSKTVQFDEKKTTIKKC